MILNDETSKYFYPESYLVAPSLSDRGENGILFRAQVEELVDYLKEKYGIQVDITFLAFLNRTRLNTVAASRSVIIKGYFRANPPEDTDHFSIDNMIGLYRQSLRINKDTLKLLPIFKWNGSYNFHPHSWLVYLFVKYPFIKYLIIPYLAILGMFLYSCYSDKYSDTSGFNLWFIRLRMMKMNKLLDFYISVRTKKMKDDPNLNSVFSHIEDGLVYNFAYYFTQGWENKDNMNQPIIKILLESKLLKI